MATVGLKTPKVASSQENGFTIPGSFVVSPTTHATPFGATPVATSPQVQGNEWKTTRTTTPAKSLASSNVHPSVSPISRKTPNQLYKELYGNIANEPLGLLFEVEFQEQAIQTLEAVENKNQRNFRSMQRNFAMLSKGHLALQNQRSDRSRAILDCLDRKNAALQKLLQSKDAKKLMPHILEQYRPSRASATPQPRARNASPLNLEAQSIQDLSADSVATVLELHIAEKRLDQEMAQLEREEAIFDNLQRDFSHLCRLWKKMYQQSVLLGRQREASHAAIAALRESIMLEHAQDILRSENGESKQQISSFNSLIQHDDSHRCSSIQGRCRDKKNLR